MARPIVRSTTGFAQLGENMRLLAGPVAKKICGKATGKAAQLVKRAAIRNAPVSKEPHRLNDVIVQPGNLKKNIIVKKIKSPLSSEHIVTVRGKRAGGYARRYGRLVEFGTVKMAAEPFLRPAFEQNKQDAVEVMRTSLDKEITAAVAGMKK